MASSDGSSAKAPVKLPIIDISDLSIESGKATLQAAIDYGFLYVDSVSTDFTPEKVEWFFTMIKEFFASPHEEKAQFAHAEGNIGWGCMHRETLDPAHQQRGDFKESFNFAGFENGKSPHPLPPAIQPHEEEINNFITICQNTCSRLLTLLELGLELPPDWFTSRHFASGGPTGSILRLLYYPSLKSSLTSTFQHDVDVRAGAHSDYGSITLLFQRDGQPGLEIQTATGEWAPVPVRPINTVTAQQTENSVPPILVNIGDLLSFWTNGLLKSTVHRVVFPKEERSGTVAGQDRYSSAFFCHPLDDTELVPVPSKLVEQQRKEMAGHGPEAGKVKTAAEHLASRLASTYI